MRPYQSQSIFTDQKLHKEVYKTQRPQETPQLMQRRQFNYMTLHQNIQTGVQFDVGMISFKYDSSFPYDIDVMDTIKNKKLIADRRPRGPDLIR